MAGSGEYSNGVGLFNTAGLPPHIAASVAGSADLPDRQNKVSSQPSDVPLEGQVYDADPTAQDDTIETQNAYGSVMLLPQTAFTTDAGESHSAATNVPEDTHKSTDAPNDKDIGYHGDDRRSPDGRMRSVGARFASGIREAAIRGSEASAVRFDARLQSGVVPLITKVTNQGDKDMSEAAGHVGLPQLDTNVMPGSSAVRQTVDLVKRPTDPVAEIVLIDPDAIVPLQDLPRVPSRFFYPSYRQAMARREEISAANSNIESQNLETARRVTLVTQDALYLNELPVQPYAQIPKIIERVHTTLDELLPPQIPPAVSSKMRMFATGHAEAHHVAGIDRAQHFAPDIEAKLLPLLPNLVRHLHNVQLLELAGEAEEVGIRRVIDTTDTPAVTTSKAMAALGQSPEYIRGGVLHYKGFDVTAVLDEADVHGSMHVLVTGTTGYKVGRTIGKKLIDVGTTYDRTVIVRDVEDHPSGPIDRSYLLGLNPTNVQAPGSVRVEIGADGERRQLPDQDLIFAAHAVLIQPGIVDFVAQALAGRPDRYDPRSVGVGVQQSTSLELAIDHAAANAWLTNPHAMGARMDEIRTDPLQAIEARKLDS